MRGWGQHRDQSLGHWQQLTPHCVTQRGWAGGRHWRTAEAEAPHSPASVSRFTLTNCDCLSELIVCIYSIYCANWPYATLSLKLNKGFWLLSIYFSRIHTIRYVIMPSYIMSQITLTLVFFLNLPKVPVADCQCPWAARSAGHLAAVFSSVAKNNFFFPPRSFVNRHCWCPESKYKYIES